MAKRVTNVEDDFVDVPFVWSTSSPDPVQYKPYNPQFTPLDVIVIVQVPERYVINVENITSGKEPKTIYYLSPKGMAYASKELAKAIMAGHNGEL